MAKDPYIESWRYAGTTSQRYEPYYDDRQQMPLPVDTLANVLSTTQVAVDIRDALVSEMAIDMPPDWAPRARQG
ncbi:hypothetical protein ABBQ38_009792 [Trebouxia sp. C0009 RCD-2024]